MRGEWERIRKRTQNHGDWERINKRTQIPTDETDIHRGFMIILLWKSALFAFHYHTPKGCCLSESRLRDQGTTTIGRTRWKDPLCMRT